MAKSFIPKRREMVAGEPHFESAAFGQAYPALYQLLAASTDGDRPRLPASLSFFAEQGRLKACIFDRSTSMVWFCTLNGSSDVLGAVEQALQDGSGEWRAKRAR